MTFGSLFAGIGGMDLGLERAGMECRWQVEIDPYCQRVLAKHWPNVKRWDDVRTFPPRSYEFTYSWRGCPVGPFAPDVRLDTTQREWGVDLICGGFPCQDISSAGHKIGITGERSGLWTEYLRIIGVVRPRFAIVENVAALLVRGMDRVLGDLASIGFDAEWEVIPACAFNAPHSRERVFIVSYPAGRGLQGCLPAKPFHAQPCSEWNGEPSRVLSRVWDHWNHDSSNTRVADGFSNRVDRVKGLGNAVVPQVAEWIGRRILEAA